jgi:hypothetical protein
MLFPSLISSGLRRVLEAVKTLIQESLAKYRFAAIHEKRWTKISFDGINIASIAENTHRSNSHTAINSIIRAGVGGQTMWTI